MSLVSDLFEIADRIVGALRHREQSDSAVFRKLIDPMYVQLNRVVNETVDMYKPTVEALIRLREERDRLPRLDDGQERRFLAEHGEDLGGLVSSFKQKRAETRQARIKVDAAAFALLEHYKSRKDEFADRVRELTTQIRSIVGRAHNRPLEATSSPRRRPVDRPRRGDRSNRVSSAQVEDRLDNIEGRRGIPSSSRVEDHLEEIGRRSERLVPATRHRSDRAESDPLTDSVESALDETIVIDTSEDLDRHIQCIEDILATIDGNRDKAAYTYEMLRVAANTDVSD